jgi:mono/diheme cytochrome c family protein
VRRALVFILGGILLAGCSLAGDVTPPPALATAQAAAPVMVAPTEPAQASPPDIAPDPNAGQAIYQARCSPCHGAQGMGDGEQAASLSNPPSPLGDQEFARTAKPADWYTVVTQGRMDRFMPPFTSLTDTQRWDVVAYALTLSTSEASLSEGEQVYSDTCASCHGPSGEGTARGPALNTPTFMANHTLEDVFAAATDGVGGEMPGFADRLSEDERWAAASYVRTLAFGAEALQGNAETAPAVPASDGSIHGQATNGTTGEPVQGDFEVNLIGFDADAQAVDTSTTLGPDGTYAFDGLDIVEGRIFGVTLQYKGVVYFSDAAHLSQASPDVTLPLVVYDTTSDASQLTVDRLHLIFDFPGGDTVRVLELWVLSNNGNATIVGDGDQAAVEIPLPSGATNLGLPGDTLSQDIQFTDQGVAVLAPIMPGSGTGEVVFNFDLPYNRSLDFSQSMTYPVAAVVALLPEGGAKLSGPGWQDLGVQDIGGSSYQNMAMGALNAGQTLDFSLSGRASSSGGVGLSTSNLAIGLGVFGLTLVAVGLWWYRPWLRPAAAGAPEVDSTQMEATGLPSILQQIADLDEAFEAGELGREAYRRRRDALKAKALALRRSQDD